MFPLSHDDELVKTLSRKFPQQLLEVTLLNGSGWISGWREISRGDHCTLDVGLEKVRIAYG